jgi:hypothetical protein
VLETSCLPTCWLSEPRSADALHLMQAAALYAHGAEDCEAAPIRNTFQVIFLAGWAPDPSQPKAAKRGSATASMKDIQSVVEATRGKQ